MSSSNPVFPVGPAGKRELRRALLRSTDPVGTITTFQQSHSLHTMMAQAFGTVPSHEKKEVEDKEKIESLDTDSVMMFLSRLGVNQHEVHKRISDTLLKQLEDEIRKTGSQEALVELLKSCWTYATTLQEFRPVLWAVLKRLGEKTPNAVLIALAERDESNALKYTDIFKPLPTLLKRLVWEADWEKRITLKKEISPKEYLEMVKSTMLLETVEPVMQEYLTNKLLIESANKPFVASIRESRVQTTQRRAFTATNIASSASNSVLRGTGGAQTVETLNSGKAVTHLRSLLCDTTGAASAYRPKLLYAVLSVLIAQHGINKTDLLGGAGHLHCTLAADILLSTGGPLPKAYQDVLVLARLLDECVQEGNISNTRVAKIQDALRDIFQHDEDGAPLSPQKDTTSKKKETSEDLPSNSIQRQLDRIITSGLSAIKETDAQHLFTNPVTDEIAPGYSKLIKYPMCVSTMESKVESHEYKSPSAWEKDVKLMYKNCLDYNRGVAGQWFRGEANRQLKVFRDEIFPQARRLYQNEVAKRTVTDDAPVLKRKADDEAQMTPLEAANKKRKSDHKDREDFLPSMPALAFMLLSDPFVVRIFLARILRDLRRGVLEGNSVPVAHGVVPSLLQFLHMANWSTRVCAMGARLYAIPDVGAKLIGDSSNPAAMIPFATLRRLLPLLLRLLLESELDRRTIYGGNLYDADQSSNELKPSPIPAESWGDGSQMRVALALMEGGIVHICQPESTTDNSLSVSFPKHASALQQLSPSFLDDRVFLVCMVSAIKRHKHKIAKPTRDAILASWMEWLSLKTSSKKGSMCSAAHECLLMLLNEWHGMGNQVLPRDDLVTVASESVAAANKSESRDSRKFSDVWFSDSEEFAPIKNQYMKMLQHFPEAVASQWKDDVGIADHQAMSEPESKPGTIETALQTEMAETAEKEKSETVAETAEKENPETAAGTAEKENPNT